MKSSFLLIFVLLYVGAESQRLQYSRQNVIVNFPDAMQLVANISGHHHLIALAGNKKPEIHIFDPQLKLVGKVTMPFKLPENCDLKVFNFRNFYFLYAHVGGSGHHDLWRIDSKGNITPLSDALEKLVDSNLAKTRSPLQMSAMQNNLVIVSHAYFRDIEKVVTTVVQVDSTLSVLWKQKVSYVFFPQVERIQQISVLNRHDMLVLKSSKEGFNNTLELMKINLDSGIVIGTTYSSHSNTYVNPQFFYNSKDSSITVYSMIRDAFGGSLVRSIFMSKLNSSLGEVVPVTVLRTQFRNNTYANFLLLAGETPHWIGMYGPRPTITVRSSYSMPYDPRTQGPSYNSEGLYLPDYRGTSGIGTGAPYQASTAVRFSLLDNKFRIVRDSLVTNDKPKYNIEPQQFARFTGKNKSYLLLHQHFRGNRKGLIMIGRTENNDIETTDIRINDRFEFMLGQLQQVADGAVILPYTHRREAGLLKILVNE